MSSDRVAVRVRNLSKAYSLGRSQSRHTTLAEALMDRLHHPWRRPSSEVLWALKDVCVEIGAGETFGIVGPNGAGKSTLLKIISRITEPTRGEIELYGRVGSLLEVGTGFHPELTGRENVYLSGAVLGMRRSEVRRQFDRIVEFAGIEKFLDTPVKRYSSGMFLRLGFAVAAHLDTEILIVDEVLAVGDAAFQRRCLDRMGEVARGEGRTVIFVSHNLRVVDAVCTRAILLEGGSVVGDGAAEDITRLYQERATEIGAQYRVATPLLHWRGIANRDRLRGLKADEDLRFLLAFGVGEEDVHGLHVDLAVTNERDETVVHTKSRFVVPGFDLSAHSQVTLEYVIRSPKLVPGRYFLTVYAFAGAGNVLFWADRIEAFDVSSSSYFGLSQFIETLRSPIVPEFSIRLQRPEES